MINCSKISQNIKSYIEKNVEKKIEEIECESNSGFKFIPFKSNLNENVLRTKEFKM